MVTEISHYLDSVRNNLRLDQAEESEVTSELEAHIDDRLRELRQTGLSEEEAVSTCVRLLGSAKLVARQIYEAHSQGTWRQALMASMPHLLFGLLFALNWWRGVGWLAVVLMLVIGTAIYGWWHGKPAWLFPWLGCSLLPVVMTGLMLLYLPSGWAWVTIILYVLLALWLLYRVTVQTIRRDWLYSSLTLFPVPVVLGWFLAVNLDGHFPELSVEHLLYFAPSIGLSFLFLAVAVAAFVRLRQRWLKIAVLFLSGLLTLVMTAAYTGGRINLPAFLFLILVLLGIFLTPALLERRLRYGRQ